MSRFILTKSVFLISLAFLLLGCNQQPRSEETVTPTTVSFMVFGDAAEVAAYEKLVAAFEAKYPEINIELRSIPSQDEFFQRLAADFSAGAPPDVMLLNYRRYAIFASQGGLEPLDSYLKASDLVKEKDFYPQAIQAFTWGQKTWCIPQNASSLVVYYNQNLFDAAGLAYPVANWTHSDFLAAAHALTQDLNGHGQIDQYGAGIEPSLMRLAPFIWQAGGELVDDPVHPTRLTLDSPQALDAFQWFANLQVKEKVVPDATAESAESDESRFLNGRLGMYFDSRKAVPTMRTITGFRWDIALLPQGDQPASILHSDGYCMATHTLNKEAAWKFIEFANSYDGQVLMLETGRTVPSNVVVAQSSAFLDPSLPPASSHLFIDIIPVLHTLPIISTWPAIEETANQEIERAFYGQISVNEAAAIAVTNTQQYFDQATQYP
jgi:multiple sugar transport system substrate-binding protein